MVIWLTTQVLLFTFVLLHLKGKYNHKIHFSLTFCSLFGMMRHHTSFIALAIFKEQTKLFVDKHQKEHLGKVHFGINWSLHAYGRLISSFLFEIDLRF